MSVPAMSSPGGSGPRLVQIVLAAGRSSRMGEPKALLDFRGSTALSLVLAAACSTVERSIIVVAPDGEGWRDAHDDGSGGQDWVVNSKPDAEQIDSLARGLERLRGLDVDGFFVHPVDFPLPSSCDYARVGVAVGGSGQGAVDVLKPRWEGRHGHPILCRLALAESFIEASRSGGTSRDVVRRSSVASVDVSDAGVVDDMDTPEDYRRLLARYDESR